MVKDESSQPVGVAQVEKRFNAVLVLIVLQIVEFMQRKLAVDIRIQMSEHPLYFRLAAFREHERYTNRRETTTRISTRSPIPTKPATLIRNLFRIISANLGCLTWPSSLTLQVP